MVLLLLNLKSVRFLSEKTFTSGMSAISVQPGGEIGGSPMMSETGEEDKGDVRFSVHQRSAAMVEEGTFDVSGSRY